MQGIYMSLNPMSARVNFKSYMSDKYDIYEEDDVNGNIVIRSRVVNDDVNCTFYKKKYKSEKYKCKCLYFNK